MAGHPEAATRFVADDERLHWHDQAVWWVRQKRDTASAAVTDWEELRAAAAAIKRHVLSRLADYLEELERNATALGAKVHWAADAVGGLNELMGLRVRQKLGLAKISRRCFAG